MTDISKYSTFRNIFKELHILPVSCVYSLEIASFVKFHYDDFKKNNYYHIYAIRNQNDLLIPIHTLSIYKKSPRYMEIKLSINCKTTLKQLPPLKYCKTFTSRSLLCLFDAIK